VFTRPYHVPADVDDLDPADRPDFKQFLALRDKLITQVFDLKINLIVAGGTKARDLAKQVKLL
jgi:hypothetical protein